MNSVRPPVWSDEQLESDSVRALMDFRRGRMQEPLEIYLEAFHSVVETVEVLLEATNDLAGLQVNAAEVLSDPGLLEAARYISGPPVSADDLKVLADASLAPSPLAGRSQNGSPRCRDDTVRH